MQIKYILALSKIFRVVKHKYIEYCVDISRKYSENTKVSTIIYTCLSKLILLQMKFSYFIQRKIIY